MNALIQEIINDPISSLLIIGNLILIESLLSVDNAAVLATMVMRLPHEQRSRALKYGIFGAYLFRGISLFLVNYLIKIWWLKAVGGLYLIYLVWSWWKGKRENESAKEDFAKANGRLYTSTAGR